MSVRQDQSWKLEELASESGVSARTVRYYVQRGLLPAPQFRGKDTAYSEEHLVRLRAIRALQARFLPLDAIQAELERASLDELRALGEGRAPPGGVQVAPAPHPYRAPEPPPRPLPDGERVVRYRLRPGLILELGEDADAETRALAERLRTEHNEGSSR